MPDQLIVVTGAAGVLGRAVVARLAQSGARVIGVDLVADKESMAAHFVAGVDLADPKAVVAADIAQGREKVDGLVNIAGGFRWETLADGDIESWDTLYRLNLRTAVSMCQAMLPLLRAAGAGAVVNVGAAATLKAGAGMGAYTASKSGVARLTEALAEEEKDRSVRVNAVLPSIIDTPANRADMPDADVSRWVAPDALADVVAFLLSDQARAITGACIPVTGRV